MCCHRIVEAKIPDAVGEEMRHLLHLFHRFGWVKFSRAIEVFRCVQDRPVYFWGKEEKGGESFAPVFGQFLTRGFVG